MAVTKVKVEERLGHGKNAANRLRKKGLIPANIYARHEDNINIAISEAEFLRVYKEAGTTSVLNILIGDNNSVPGIIKEIQKHPFKNEILHVDFQKVNMDEKIRMIIPIVLINRDDIEDVKTKQAVLMQMIDEVEIECLPGDIPEAIEVDVSGMDLENPIVLSDLDIAKNDDITVLAEMDEVICTLTLPTLEAEEDEEVDEDAEPALVGEEEETEEE